MASTDATPLPLKNTAFRWTFPLWLTTGLANTGAAGLDSEVSIDGGTFADCTNEATEIATGSGKYYLDLTAGEMNGDTIAIQVKSSTTNAIQGYVTIYPSSGSKFQVNATQIGSQTASAVGTVTFPGTIASATNITAGTITTVTNLMNAPSSGDFTSTMKTSIGTAVAASAVASVTGNVGGNVTGSVGSVTGLTASNLDATVSSRLASSSYTAPPSAATISSTVWAETIRVLTAGTNIVLPSNGLSGISTWTVAITGNITGNLSGSVGSVTAGVTVSTLGAGSIATATFASGATIPRCTLVDTVTAVTGFTASDISAIKTKTDFLPSITPGLTGGLLIVGTNASTTFSGSGLVLAAMSIGGIANVSQTADSKTALTKIQAATYDTATLSGSTLTLSNAATMVIGTSGRVTT